MGLPDTNGGGNVIFEACKVRMALFCCGKGARELAK
jgi:hypothetical protein